MPFSSVKLLGMEMEGASHFPEKTDVVWKCRVSSIFPQNLCLTASEGYDRHEFLFMFLIFPQEMTLASQLHVVVYF